MSKQIKLGSFFYYKDVEYDAWYHFDDKRRVYAPHHQSLALDLVAELEAERDKLIEFYEAYKYLRNLNDDDRGTESDIERLKSAYTALSDEEKKE